MYNRYHTIVENRLYISYYSSTILSVIGSSNSQIVTPMSPGPCGGPLGKDITIMRSPIASGFTQHIQQLDVGSEIDRDYMR